MADPKNGSFTPLNVRKPYYHNSITQSFFHPPGHSSYQSLHYRRLSLCNRIKKHLWASAERRKNPGRHGIRQILFYVPTDDDFISGRDDCIRHLMTSLQLPSLRSPLSGPIVCLSLSHTICNHHATR